MQTPSADGLGWDLDRAVECAMCVACSKAIAKPKRCKNCGLARYCSRECQLAHWDTHKFPCKKRGGRKGYLAALDVGFNKLASWQSGLVGGHNQADEMIRTLNDTLAAATAIGDAEGERFLSAELADRCQEASESAGGRIIGSGGSKEEAAAKVASYRSRAAKHRARAEQIEAIFTGQSQPEEAPATSATVSSEKRAKPQLDKEHDFSASPSFSGSRTGWIFKTGQFGLGYYRDQVAHSAQETDATVHEPAPAPKPGTQVEEDDAEDRAMLEALD